jgi:putative membrane protein insertion efficiency factor
MQLAISAVGAAARNLALVLLRIYKLTISPWLGPACRFHPTCSEYMRESVERYGAARGIWMGLRRLGKCHPLHQGGFDPVP